MRVYQYGAVPGPMLIPDDETVDIHTFSGTEASRSSGVAPLSVSFVGGLDQDIATPELSFLDHHYTWTFDDSSSGTWSTDGRSKNVEYGGSACHVYENAGTFAPTLTVRDEDGTIVYTETFSITVSDPDTYYAGSLTTCVNPAGDSTFTEAPTGARQISTDDLTTVTQYATAGSRVLFKRGASWTLSSSLSWPDNGGPVTIGAYGSGAKPQFDLAGYQFLELDFKQDWRIMDLVFADASESSTGIGGDAAMQRILMFRLDATGCGTPFGNSYYHHSTVVHIRHIAIVECTAYDFGSYGIYTSSEYLALLGNSCHRSSSTHICRVQAIYWGIISHNYWSGSSLDNSNGRHALKFHGPKESHIPAEPNSGTWDHRASYAVISCNTFGSSGSNPVAIGPQDAYSDERVEYILFERNRIITNYGTMSPINVNTQLSLWCRYSTARNNILDGTDSGDGTWLSIVTEARGIEPPPTRVHVYNNTIYRSDSGSGPWYGIRIGSGATDIEFINNLVAIIDSSVSKQMVLDNSGTASVSSNVWTEAPLLSDPDNATPLSRDYSLQAGSPAIDAGENLPIRDDYALVVRTQGSFDASAHERE